MCRRYSSDRPRRLYRLLSFACRSSTNCTAVVLLACEEIERPQPGDADAEETKRLSAGSRPRPTSCRTGNFALTTLGFFTLSARPLRSENLLSTSHLCVMVYFITDKNRQGLKQYKYSSTDKSLLSVSSLLSGSPQLPAHFRALRNMSSTRTGTLWCARLRRGSSSHAHGMQVSVVPKWVAPNLITLTVRPFPLLHLKAD